MLAVRCAAVESNCCTWLLSIMVFGVKWPKGPMVFTSHIKK